MGSLLPLKSAAISHPCETEPKLISLTDAEADHVLSSVSSTTARAILQQIYEQPQTASDLATAIDSSVQNVSYHLERMTEAGLIAVADTWYSDRGREMAVYVPTHGSLVLYVGATESEASLTDALVGALGGVGVVGIASALVHVWWPPSNTTESTRPLATDTVAPTLGETIMAFFMGPGGVVLGLGLLLIAGWLVYWTATTYRPARRRAARTEDARFPLRHPSTRSTFRRKHADSPSTSGAKWRTERCT